jgi:hypothetical protein
MAKSSKKNTRCKKKNPGVKKIKDLQNEHCYRNRKET